MVSHGGGGVRLLKSEGGKAEAEKAPAIEADAPRPIFELPFCMALPPRLGLGSALQGFFHRKGVLDSKIALRPRGGRGRRRV